MYSCCSGCAPCGIPDAAGVAVGVCVGCGDDGAGGEGECDCCGDFGVGEREECVEFFGGVGGASLSGVCGCVCCACVGCGDVVGVSVESAEASELVFDSFFGCAGCEFCGVGDDSGFGEGVGHVGGCGAGVFVEPCEVVAGCYEEGFGVFGVMRWR